MKLSKEIVAGRSLGGIALRTSVDTVIASLGDRRVLDLCNGIASIDGGVILIGYGEDRLIYSVMCDHRFNGNYLGKLWPGMTVREVLESSATQAAWGGAVVVDGIDGIGLPLPSGLDDFDQITDHLQLEHVFDHLSVFLLSTPEAATGH